MTFDRLVERARALVPEGGRAVLGIAGPPGAGKTILIRATRDRADLIVPAEVIRSIGDTRHR